MNDLVLDASFGLRWCFEDESTPGTEAVLTLLQNQKCAAWTPDIFGFEMLNGLGKGIARGRIDRNKALLLLREIHELPIRTVAIAPNEQLLALALQRNLSVYDASYLSLALTLSLPLATADGKLRNAAEVRGIEIIKP